MRATLLEVGAAKPVLSIALLGHCVGAAAARSSQILIVENGWIYRSSCTQRKEEKLHLQTSDTKETRHFWSQCLQIAEFSLYLLLRSIQVLQGPYQRLVLLLLLRSVWTRDHRNKAEKVFQPPGFLAVYLYFKQTLRAWGGGLSHGVCIFLSCCTLGCLSHVLVACFSEVF